MTTVKVKNTTTNSVVTGRVSSSTDMSCRVTFRDGSTVYSVEYCKLTKKFMNVDYANYQILDK